MEKPLISRHVVPSLAITIGMALPLMFTKSSWAQATNEFNQSNSVLYYGWQSQATAPSPETLNPASSGDLELSRSIPNASTITEVESEAPFEFANNIANEAVYDPINDFTNNLKDDSGVLANPTEPIILPFDAANAATADAPAITTQALETPNSETIEFVQEAPLEDSVEDEFVEEVTVVEEAIDGIVPAATGETIADIEVRFLDKNGEVEEGHTRPSVYLREFDLEPGTPYDEARAQSGLDRLLRMPIVQQADVVLEPTAAPDEVTMVVLVRERNSPIVIDIASVSSSPTGLDGPFQLNPVLGRGTNQTTGLSAVGSVRFLNLGGNDQSLTLQLEGGETAFNTEVSFRDPWIGDDPTGIAFNLFNQRSVQRVFAEGNRDVDLPNLNTPWVHRWGGGVEVFRPVAEDWDLALGVNYQQVSIHNSAFETERFERDQLGERLIVSDDDYDDLLTVQFSGEFNQVEYLENAILSAPLFDLPPEPIEGPRFRFGVDQAIPVGDASIAFTRLSANYLHYLPLDLFGFTEGPRTLVLNAQTGVMFGDIPPYEAFGIDAGPLGNYESSGLASGSRFALVVAEYRFPIANFRLIRRDIELGGTLFSGFASTLGSADEVIGDPSVSRQKPEDGFVGGIGIRARTAFGLFRVEVSINDDGNAQFVITGGGKF